MLETPLSPAPNFHDYAHWIRPGNKRIYELKEVWKGPPLVETLLEHSVWGIPGGYDVSGLLCQGVGEDEDGHDGNGDQELAQQDGEHLCQEDGLRIGEPSTWHSKFEKSYTGRILGLNILCKKMWQKGES